VPHGSYPAPKTTRLDYLAPGFITQHAPSLIRLSFWLGNPLDSTANERLIKSKVQASRYPGAGV
jgi:hypothetical protein